MIEKLKPTLKGFDDKPQMPTAIEFLDKINELVDAVNELQNRIDPPSVYRVMKERDELIAKHIGEKNALQKENSDLKDEVELLKLQLQVAENTLDSIRLGCGMGTMSYNKADIGLREICKIRETKGGDNE